MGKILRIASLEESGILNSHFQKEYDKLPSNATRRACLHSVVRSGHAAELMGLAPMIAMLEANLGQKFLKMSKQERLQRLLTLISAVTGEDVPVVAPAPAPAPAATAELVTPPAEPAPVTRVSSVQEAPPAAEQPAEPVPEASELPVITRDEETNSTERLDNPPKQVPSSLTKARRLHRSGQK
ncbi:hypothetical protein [Pantoea sp. Acro-807]|uniref:hypothetical protein n=1 Tax=Pantoea sp. Acro-807 TaxID=2608356 RepID=UPI001419A7AF|nr:hypothetical protein [Pantoea sp. Acro-807]NIE72733.1 hypothetical protein [Pantoea sp. Acro-807]